MKRLLTYLLPILVVYLIFCIISLDFNITHWSRAERITFVSIEVVTMLVTFLLAD
jgi:hypothetical protein